MHAYNVHAEKTHIQPLRHALSTPRLPEPPTPTPQERSNLTALQTPSKKKKSHEKLDLRRRQLMGRTTSSLKWGGRRWRRCAETLQPPESRRGSVMGKTEHHGIVIFNAIHNSRRRRDLDYHISVSLTTLNHWRSVHASA